MTVENFVFEKIEKSQKLLVFCHFWANFGCFSHPRHTILMSLYDTILMSLSFGCRTTVQNFIVIVWTVFEKFEIFIGRSGEKNKKNVTIA